MIKLIASDLDGTILLNGAQSVDASLIKTIDRIVDMGYIFAPASGRQINSLRTLFSPIADKLMYIGENGALVKYKGNTIVKNAMNKDLALEIIEDVMKQPNCEVLISGEDVAYIKPKTKEYYDRMTKIVKYKGKIVDDFSQIQEDILKIVKDMNPDGIESNYIYIDKDNNEFDECEKWNRFAKNNNLFVTVGTDFHNSDGIRPEIGFVNTNFVLTYIEIDSILKNLL